MPRFDGVTYEKSLDQERLDNQLFRVLDCMIDRKWRTVEQIQVDIYSRTQFHDKENSISAQLRNLRKERFGAYTVNRRHVLNAPRGTYEYQVLEPKIKKETQLLLIEKGGY